MDTVKSPLITQTDDISKRQSKLTSITINFIVVPFRAGIFGFLIYFAIIAGTKFFAYFFGLADDFSLGIYDLLLSSIGFLYSFIYYFLKNFTSK